MNVLGLAVWREIQEAEAKAMERLLQAWDREIEARWEMLEAAQRTKVQDAVERAARADSESGRRLRDATAEARRDAEAANDAAIAQAVEAHLRGLVAKAAAGDDVGPSIPSGVRCAGPLGGTSPAEIAALAAEARVADEPAYAKAAALAAEARVADEPAYAKAVARPPRVADEPAYAKAVGDERRLEGGEAAQRSALWALGRGLLPHPGDLSALLHKTGRDPTWRAGLEDIARGLHALVPDGLSGGDLGPIQLRAERARERLTLLQAERDLLADYGARRLLTLVARPSDLTADLPRVYEPRGPKGSHLGQSAMDALLDGLFSGHRPRSG